MEICPLSRSPPLRHNRRPIILVKKAICVDHGGNCNCCCCCDSKSKVFKYIQPDVPKSFAPIRTYRKSCNPLEKYTTYERSYWPREPTSCKVKPFKHQVSLTVGDGPITDDTTHKLSYLGNWCLRRQKFHMVPCDKQWLGRGPMQDITTNKFDYTWKLVPKPKAFKNQANLCCPNANFSSDTTYKLSYYGSGCRIPIKSFKPIRKYTKGTIPIDDCTTYNLSYWPNNFHSNGHFASKKKFKYHPPSTSLDSCTTYRLSYWPNRQQMRKPFTLKDTENLLNANFCPDDKTTYNLSYYGCGGDRRQPIKPSSSTPLSSCPLSHDTIHRLSYLGNWSVAPEIPRLPCSRMWSGRGPMQRITTHKNAFTWKCSLPGVAFSPTDNLKSSHQPLECCTIQKLSYFPNNPKNLIPNKSFKPIRTYQSFNIPTERETTMRLSYQPVKVPISSTHSWPVKSTYEKPLQPSNDTTTYNLSYIPPGEIMELDCLPRCKLSQSY